MVERVEEGEDGIVRIEVRLTIVGCPAASRIERDVREAVAGAIGRNGWELELGVMTPEQRTALTERLRGSRPSAHPFGRDSLTRVIAVTSGKGGVGKSTVAANLSARMAADGLRVGLVDADVHGFSIPGLMGLAGEGADERSETGSARPTRVGELILPPVIHGVKVISIGMFLGGAEEDPEHAGIVAWRGPMLHRTLEQFLRDVHFGDLDVLLLDLPPGTGDIAISMGQLLPGAEVVVVTTPQPAAAEVAWRSGALARKTGQRVVGVIETMSPATMPDGSRFALFGEGGGRLVAERLSDGGSGAADGSDVEAVPVLAEVPVDELLRADGDAGTPHVLAHPDSPAAIALAAAARALAARPRGLAGRSLGLSPR
ncbi:Iron-sulfur cluster carrier protein [Pseudoclavibacter triregionum]|nr:Iron-sulfur cluster carrier protein [Pseudoclavibacter triregionum]